MSHWGGADRRVWFWFERIRRLPVRFKPPTHSSLIHPQQRRDPGLRILFRVFPAHKKAPGLPRPGNPHTGGETVDRSSGASPQHRKQAMRRASKHKAPGRLQRPLKLAEDQFVPAPCLCTANQGGESVALPRAFHDIGNPKNGHNSLQAGRLMPLDGLSSLWSLGSVSPRNDRPN